MIDFLYSNLVEANRLEFLKIKPTGCRVFFILYLMEALIESFGLDSRVSFGTAGEVASNGDNSDTEVVKQSCVIDFICQEHMGIAREAKRIRTYWWQPKIKSLVTARKCLYGSTDPVLTGFLDVSNFTKNR